MAFTTLAHLQSLITSMQTSAEDFSTYVKLQANDDDTNVWKATFVRAGTPYAAVAASGAAAFTGSATLTIAELAAATTAATAEATAADAYHDAIVVAVAGT